MEMGFCKWCQPCARCTGQTCDAISVLSPINTRTMHAADVHHVANNGAIGHVDDCHVELVVNLQRIVAQVVRGRSAEHDGMGQSYTSG